MMCVSVMINGKDQNVKFQVAQEPLIVQAMVVVTQDYQYISAFVIQAGLVMTATHQIALDVGNMDTVMVLSIHLCVNASKDISTLTVANYVNME